MFAWLYDNPFIRFEQISRNITLVPTDNLITLILSLNDATQYGARKVKNLVESIVKLKLSIALLNNTISNNNVVTLDWKNDLLNISTKKQRKVKPVEAVDETI